MLASDMSETATPEQPPASLAIPKALEAVISEFDSRTSAYDTFEVESALNVARRALVDPTAEEAYGAWAEVLAFALVAGEHGEKPWGTTFGPMGSGTTKDGQIVYFPDITQATPVVLEHWADRTTQVKAPVLVARYNDLVWDLSKLMASQRPAVGHAHSAIDAYVAIAAQADREIVESFDAASRALTLALQINDTARRHLARKTILSLHQRAIAENSMWWQAHDLLFDQPKAGLTDDERDTIIADIEAVLARVSDQSNPSTFDPHATESAANKLIDHYRSIRRSDEVHRLLLTVARTFEHFGSLADPMLASMVYQTSMDAYRQAGLRADEARLLSLIEKANLDSIDQMAPIEYRREIPKEEVETFIAGIVGKTKEETLHQLARAFLIHVSDIEATMARMTKSSPLLAMIQQTKLDGERIVAHIGSVEDDPVGRTIHHAQEAMGLSTPWLGWTMHAAMERQGLTAADFVEWMNRAGVFRDETLLTDGVEAWLAEDYLKAIHILVPQVEAGFRTMVGKCGRPTTKAHPQMPQARMVITMGEILFHKDTPEALGPEGNDLVLHMRALYVDPRGHNLRNDVAHGLLERKDIHAGIMLWVIHSLMLIGAWLTPVEEAQQDRPNG